MNHKLTLYIVEGHASCTVQNGVSRQTTATNVPAMLAGMPDADRAVLEQFCRIVLAAPRLEK